MRPSPLQEKGMPSPASTILPSQKLPGVFLRVLNSVPYFFKNLFLHKNNSPNSELQGTWKVEQVLMFDPTLNAFRQVQAGGNYVEFKNNKICKNGKLGSNGLPVPCSSYDIFRIEGGFIIVQNNAKNPTVRWKINDRRLELSIEPKAGELGQKQKVVLIKM